MSRTPFSVGVWILGGGAVLLTVFLVIGFLLPGDWEASASRVISGRPETVLGYLDSPEGWEAWTPWPENGVQRSGPARGPGARLSWDDPDLGSGSFTLYTVEPGRVTYAVDVEGGAMHSTGVLTLTAAEGGVRVDWHEEGDLGRNPLMGYWALSMGRAQSEELAKGLERLDSLVAASIENAPSGSAPSR